MHANQNALYNFISFHLIITFFLTELTKSYKFVLANFLFV